ncbi:MAG: hypothetical protein QOH81_2371 [Sphingomonadales bacterium]|jgi:hypothetical protein|nr:hypothetical protein [Sphingomonadales bacterium]
MSEDRSPAHAGAQPNKKVWTPACAGEQVIFGCKA